MIKLIKIIYFIILSFYFLFFPNVNAQERIKIGFIRSLGETLSDLALTFIPGDGIVLAGSLIRSIYSDIDKVKFEKIFMGNKSNIHQEMLKMISIGVILKEKTPLYGNFNLLKKISS